MRNSPRLPCPFLQCPCGKYVIIARSPFFSVAVKNLAFLYLSSNFSSKCRMILPVFYFMLYPSTRKLSLWVISARVQKSECSRIAILFSFLGEGQRQRAGGTQSNIFFLYILKFIVSEKIQEKSVLMFWIPYASNNRALMFELIKNFLSSKTTLNG